MKQDNHIPYTLGLDGRDRLDSEVMREIRALKALNAELVRTLNNIVERMEQGFVPSQYIISRARAALDKARE